MSAFAAGVDAIFADPHMAREARYLAAAGAPATVRVILSRPDQVRDFSLAAVVTDTVLVDVRVSDVPAPCLGDRVEIGDETFVVQSDPVRDRERLVWRLDLRPVE